MPRKFRRYVEKGYSRKGSNSRKRANSAEAAKVKVSVLPEADSLVDLVVQTDPQFSIDDHMVHSETQTDGIMHETTAVQTDILISGQTKTVETQTEIVAVLDAGVQVGEPLAKNEMRLCIGNNDEKFLPLVTKHKGVFKDVTGLYAMHII